MLRKASLAPVNGYSRLIPVVVAELFPEAGSGDRYNVPCDAQVLNVVGLGSPLDRMEAVLRAAGIDPHEPDCWTDSIGEAGPRR